MSRKPILVTGAIRSGTTWVGRILASAPGVALIHEPFNVDHPKGVFAHGWSHQYAYMVEGSEESEVVADAMSDTLAFRYRPVAHLGSLEGVRRTVGLLRDLPRFWFRKAFSQPRPLVKDPIAIFSAPWLEKRFDMDVVVTVRHPGAFTWSYIRIGEPNRFADLTTQPALIEGPLAPHADEIEEAARTDDPIRQAATLWRTVYAVVDGYRSRYPDWSIVRHEDLSLNPFGEFPKLFDTVDLEFTSATRRYLERSSSSHNPTEAPPGVLHQLRRDSMRNVSVWKRRLSGEDVRRLHRLTADVADRFYPPATWG